MVDRPSIVFAVSFFLTPRVCHGIPRSVRREFETVCSVARVTQIVNTSQPIASESRNWLKRVIIVYDAKTYDQAEVARGLFMTSSIDSRAQIIFHLGRRISRATKAHYARANQLDRWDRYAPITAGSPHRSQRGRTRSRGGCASMSRKIACASNSRRERLPIV